MLKTEPLSSLASTVYSTGLSFSLPLLSVCLSLPLSLFLYVSLSSITSPEPGAGPPHKCHCPHSTLRSHPLRLLRAFIFPSRENKQEIYFPILSTTPQET